MIKTFKHEGIEIVMSVNKETTQDEQCWLAGRFNDLSLLNVIRRTICNGTIVEVGSGIGNNTIFYSKIIGCRVISFEKDKKKYELLRKNVVLNDVKGFIGNYEISDIRKKSDKTSVNVLNLLVMEPVDAIRINCKNQWMQVLSGGRKLIKEYKPDLFINVEKQKTKDVENYLLENFKLRYKLVDHLEIGYIHEIKHFKIEQ